jgi:hypothetical protein
LISEIHPENQLYITMKSLALALLSIVVASPAFALPAPTDLNLTTPTVVQPAKMTPLVWDYRRAEIEALAVEAIRNGVEPEFIKAVIIRGEAVKSPTRIYKYSELDRLVDSVYAAAKSKVGQIVIVRGLD